MNTSYSKIKLFLALIFTIVLFNQLSFAACIECEEVAKGKIPLKFLDKSIKTLPSGVIIWDNKEAMQALKNKSGKYLWVDTRPASFLKLGTIKKAVNIVCDLKGINIAKSDMPHAMSKERIKAESKKIDPDINAVTIIFFCQGPKCHRSYDAALRAVNDYNLNPSKIVWYRDGYPNLEKYILNNPKLKRKISKYLKGDVVNK